MFLFVHVVFKDYMLDCKLCVSYQNSRGQVFVLQLYETTGYCSFNFNCKWNAKRLPSDSVTEMKVRVFKY